MDDALPSHSSPSPHSTLFLIGDAGQPDKVLSCGCEFSRAIHYPGSIDCGVRPSMRDAGTVMRDLFGVAESLIEKAKEKEMVCASYDAAEDSLNRAIFACLCFSDLLLSRCVHPFTLMNLGSYASELREKATAWTVTFGNKFSTEGRDMNAGDVPGQGGHGGVESGAGSGSHSNGPQPTIISSQKAIHTDNFITTTANLQTQTTTATQPPTVTATSSPSSGPPMAAIIGVIGFIGALPFVVFLAIYLVKRRQRKHTIEKRESAEPVTYANLNNSFAGVQFGHSHSSSQDESLLPSPLQLTARIGTLTAHSRQKVRGGEGHEFDVERNGGGYILPSYNQTQEAMSPGGVRSLGRLNNSTPRTGAEAIISPMSEPYPGDLPTSIATLSPRTTSGEIPLIIRQHSRERERVGFAADASDLGIHRNATPSLTVAAPIPRHPLLQQDSLARLARGGMNGTPAFQDVNLLGPMNGPTGRVLSLELMRESPVLGLMNPVRMQGTTLHSATGGGLQRLGTQRTTRSSVSSLGYSVVSDTELERLGVGSGRRPSA